MLEADGAIVRAGIVHIYYVNFAQRLVKSKLMTLRNFT